MHYYTFNVSFFDNLLSFAFMNVIILVLLFLERTSLIIPHLVPGNILLSGKVFGSADLCLDVLTVHGCVCLWVKALPLL